MQYQVAWHRKHQDMLRRLHTWQAPACWLTAKLNPKEEVECKGVMRGRESLLIGYLAAY